MTCTSFTISFSCSIRPLKSTSHHHSKVMCHHIWSPEVYQHITCGLLEMCRCKLNIFSLTSQSSKSVSPVDYVDRSWQSWILILRMLIYYSSQTSNNNKMPLFILQLKLLMTIYSFFPSKFRFLFTSTKMGPKNNSIVTIWEGTLLLIFLFWSWSQNKINREGLSIMNHHSFQKKK